MHSVIQVYEFDTIYLGQYYKPLDGEAVRFDKRHFDALLKYNELHQGKYFFPVYEGIRFKSYVGVVQVDDLIIEVLPKIQRLPMEVDWRAVLIEMLKETDHLRFNQIGNAFVDKQHIHLLDIYFDWFLTEVELLLHQGLVKQYYTESKNTLALKGKLNFAKHIQKNLVHQERFYTTHQIYGTDHLIHQILQVALTVVKNMSRGTYRYSRCMTAQLHFPEVRDILVNRKTFELLTFSRKTAPYRTAVEIARLIILNYAPNVKSGVENMLALLFNMNDLWEQYVRQQLQRSSKDVRVYGQQSQRFWKNKTIRPDIVLKWNIGEGESIFIIDTKWKNYSYETISSNDLRQLYVYADYWKAEGGMLLYPSPVNANSIVAQGNYSDRPYHAMMGQISVLNSDGQLNKKLGDDLVKMIISMLPEC